MIDVKGRPVADLTQDCQVQSQGKVDSVAVWEGEVPPGNYFLRQALGNGRVYEACITASPDWVTQVTLKRAAQRTGAANQSDAIADAAVFMRRAGVSRAPDQDAVIEGARLALSQGRDLLAEGHGAQLTDLLVVKFTDPIAGIVGGHLLLSAMEVAQPDPVQRQQFDTLVTNLRSLVGANHPDVEALSLRCTDVALRTSRPFTAPPMFRHSWQLVSDASYQRKELVPNKLWKRVHASLALGAFFVWAADKPTRAAHATQLGRWISQYHDSNETQTAPERQQLGAEQLETIATPRVRSAPVASVVTEPEWADRPLPEAARHAAHTQQVPAGAAEELWSQRKVPKRNARRRADA